MANAENYFAYSPSSGTVGGGTTSTITVETLQSLGITGRAPVVGKLTITPDIEGVVSQVVTLKQTPDLFNNVSTTEANDASSYVTSAALASPLSEGQIRNYEIYYASNLEKVYFTISGTSFFDNQYSPNWKSLPSIVTGSATNAIKIRSGSTPSGYIYTPSSSGTMTVVSSTTASTVYEYDNATQLVNDAVPGLNAPYLYVLLLQIPANTTSDARAVNIIAQDSNDAKATCTSIITLTQSGAGSFVVKPTTLNLDPTAGSSNTININYNGNINVGWSASLSDEDEE